jgi:chromosome segregation ATPase
MTATSNLADIAGTTSQISTVLIGNASQANQIRDLIDSYNGRADQIQEQITTRYSLILDLLGENETQRESGRESLKASKERILAQLESLAPHGETIASELIAAVEQLSEQTQSLQTAGSMATKKITDHFSAISTEANRFVSSTRQTTMQCVKQLDQLRETSATASDQATRFVEDFQTGLNSIGTTNQALKTDCEAFLDEHDSDMDSLISDFKTQIDEIVQQGVHKSLTAEVENITEVVDEGWLSTLREASDHFGSQVAASQDLIEQKTKSMNSHRQELEPLLQTLDPLIDTIKRLSERVQSVASKLSAGGLFS